MALAYIAIAWVAGIWCADRIPAVSSLTWTLVGVGGCGAWLFTRELARWRLTFALLAAFGFAAARLASTERDSDLAALNGSGGVTVEGLIVDTPVRRDTYVQVRIESTSVVTVGAAQQTRGLVLAQLPPHTHVEYGDRVRVTGRLRSPDEGDAFNYAAYLARRGVFSLLDRVSAVELVGEGYGNRVLALAADARGRVSDLFANLLPQPHAGILTAIITGDESLIAPEVEAAYSNSGIAHLLAVSGFNMSLVGGFALNGIQRAGPRSVWWLMAGLLALAGYTFLVGFMPSAARAAIMTAMMMVGSAVRRTTYLPISLSFALIVLTVFDPGTLFDLGFQLSFAAVLGISMISAPLTVRFAGLLRPEYPHPIPRAFVAIMAETAIVTIAASAFTMPLIGLSFGRLPLLSLVTNMLTVPVQPLIMSLGILILAFGAIPWAAQIIAWICLVPLSWTTSVAREIAHNPLDVSLYLSPMTVGVGFGMAIFVSVFQAARPRWWEWVISRKARVTAMVGSLIVSILAVGVVTSQPDGRLHVWVLDVGHSHAVLIQTPGGAQILIDGGRYPSRLLTSIGDLLPFNDMELDAVIITQPDPFEISALPAVLRRYAVGSVYTNGQSNLGAEMAEIASLAELTPILAGQSLDSGDGTIIEILYPAVQPDIEDALDDVALVLRIRYRDVSFLLGGEASSDAQRELKRSADWPLASVLLLPKHGAVLNADFLDAVQPSVIAIQTDRANLLGDPDPDVLEMLPDVPVFRTDQHGRLHFSTDGTELIVEAEQ